MAEWIPERLPEDVEAERALLATCCAPGMETEAADVVRRLKGEDFIHPGHRAVFAALARLLDERLDVNAITIRDALHRGGDLHRVGDFAGLVEMLAGEEVRNPHILADILIQKRKQRDLIGIGSRLVRMAAGEERPPEELVEQAGQELFNVALGQDRRGLEHIKDVMEESYRHQLGRLRGHGSTGIPVGFPQLDELTQGFQPGNLIVLAARPGVGKTAMALNWLLRATMFHNAHSAFFSLEMSKKEVADRLIASYSQVNLKNVSYGEMDEATYQKLQRHREELDNLPIFVCDAAAITIRDIAAMVDRHGTGNNKRLDLVIIDYLQLISSPQESRGARLTEAVRIGEISRAMKILAKEHNIPVVALSQLNREVEHRQSGRPQLSDLRDSGAIEQDADIVMFIHRKTASQNRNSKAGDITDEERKTEAAPEMELIVAKHRNGPTAKIDLVFTGEHSLFREIEPEEKRWRGL